jgi:hypothetical protein
MRRVDKIRLLRFITRTSMYIPKENETNIVSFVTGYQSGAPMCNFTDAIILFIEKKFRIAGRATGWPGQIELLSRKRGSSWVQTFKQVALQFIVEDDFEAIKKELNQFFRTRVQTLVERIDPNGSPWFDDSWVAGWNEVCLLKTPWFKELWTTKELKLLRAMNSLVASGEVFRNDDRKLPSEKLLSLREKFSAL